MLDICFEDEYLIAINKPNNVLVHHSPMANNQSEESSLIELLQQQFLKQNYPVHRLDRKTSGIILCAKSKQDVVTFQNLFLTTQIRKTYWALVRGYTPELGEIDTPVKGRDANVHKEALTYFKRLKTANSSIAVHPYNNSRYSIIELKPETGRLHQLRIHMNKISHPIIGDPKYGDRFHNRMFATEFNCDKLFLHAKGLEFRHPITKEHLNVSADLPMHWHDIHHYLKFE